MHCDLLYTSAYRNVIAQWDYAVISWHSGLFSWANMFGFSQQMYLLTQIIISISLTIKPARSIIFPFFLSLKIWKLFIKKTIKNHHEMILCVTQQQECLCMFSLCYQNAEFIQLIPPSLVSCSISLHWRLECIFL